MANSITATIEGGDELDQILAGLPFEFRQKILPAATRAGAVVVQKAAREKLPKPGYPGDKDPSVSLSRNIKIVVKTYDNAVIAIVGPTFSTPHSHLVEFGHRLVRKIQSLDGVEKVEIGFVAPKPYMRPAADETAAQQHAALTKKIETMVTKFHKQFA